MLVPYVLRTRRLWSHLRRKGGYYLLAAVGFVASYFGARAASASLADLPTTSPITRAQLSQLLTFGIGAGLQTQAAAVASEPQLQLGATGGDVAPAVEPASQAGFLDMDLGLWGAQ